MILNRQRDVRLDVKTLEIFLRRLRRELKFNGQGMCICFVNNREMARLNSRFRKQAGATDVLSFPAAEENGAGLGKSRSRPKVRVSRGYLGDVAISPAVARRNAKRFGRTTAQELKVLMLHGALHLAGYDHEKDNGEMERREARLRKRLGIDEG